MPAAEKIAAGELMGLWLELPPHDEDTAGIHELSVSDRVVADWYTVECDPTTTIEMPHNPPTAYGLGSFDPLTGIAVVNIE